jgi:hypothetical protein
MHDFRLLIFELPRFLPLPNQKSKDCPAIALGRRRINNRHLEIPSTF